MCVLTKERDVIYLSCIVTMLFFIGITSLQGQQFRNYQELGGFEDELTPDSAFVYFTKHYNDAVLSKDTSSLINYLICLSSVDRARKNFSSAFDNSGEALFLAEEYSDDLLLARANEELGVLHYLFVQDEEAGINFQKSLQHYKLAYESDFIKQEELFHPYFHMVLYYNRVKKPQLAFAYIDTCELVSLNGDADRLYSIYLDEKRSILNSRAEHYVYSLELLENGISTVLSLNKDARFYAKHHSFLIVLYTSTANIYADKGKSELAIAYYEKALQIEDTYGEHAFYLSFVHQQYAAELNRTGAYAKAYRQLLLAKNINDAYLNPRNVKTQGFLKVKNRYYEELRKRNQELVAANLALAQNKQKVLRFRVFFVVILFLIVTVGFLIRSRIQFLKHQKESALNLKQQQHSKELIEHKNKELTANMLQLIEKEEIIKMLSDELSKDGGKNSSANRLLSSIEKRSVNLWDAFNSRFIEQNGDFYERLQAKVPDLSSADLKVCALIKLNFSGKEMAYLLGISLGSVHVARHRLRKKMHIERDQNLTQFINSI